MPHSEAYPPPPPPLGSPPPFPPVSAMFETTLTDLVTGIRAHKRDAALFISRNIAEIKTELRSPDFFTKSNALQKLTFLQMMGYAMSWAAFAAVEVMSSPRFALKRVGKRRESRARRPAPLDPTCHGWRVVCRLAQAEVGVALGQRP